MGGLEWWHWVIIVAAFMLLFGGYKKLPSATKSIAQSMKIFKDETRGLVHGDHSDDTPGEAVSTPVTTPASQHPAHENAGAIAAPVIAPAPTPAPSLSKDPAAAAPPAPVVVPQPAPVVAPANSLAPRPGAYAAGSRQSR